MIFPAYNSTGWTPAAEEALRSLMLKRDPLAAMHPRMPLNQPPAPMPHAKPMDMKRLRLLAGQQLSIGVIARRMGHNKHRLARVAEEAGIAVKPCAPQPQRSWG